MLAVVPVRDGVLPAGGAEAVAECAGRAIIAGSAPSADDLAGIGDDVRLVELGAFAPDAWSSRLAAQIDDDVIVLPASPDGRDLAPRLAHVLGLRLLANAIEVTPHVARVARRGGLEVHDVAIDGPVVTTLQPGVRGVVAGRGRPHVRPIILPAVTGQDAAVIEELPPDVTTMDLVEADRIVGGGAGFDGAPRFAQLADVARALGASMGVTRVITDRGWVEHQRQIGTTGVVVAPSLYIAMGVSGAVQHTAGLGTPDHVLSVNSDPHCPMMQMADLAVVADANAVLDELSVLLGAAAAS